MAGPCFSGVCCSDTILYMLDPVSTLVGGTVTPISHIRKQAQNMDRASQEHLLPKWNRRSLNSDLLGPLC